jgi:hypothetical protein
MSVHNRSELRELKELSDRELLASAAESARAHAKRAAKQRRAEQAPRDYH